MNFEQMSPEGERELRKKFSDELQKELLDFILKKITSKDFLLQVLDLGELKGYIFPCFEKDDLYIDTFFPMIEENQGIQVLVRKKGDPTLFDVIPVRIPEVSLVISKLKESRGENNDIQ